MSTPLDERLLDLLYGELSPEAEATLRAELASDATAQARLEAWGTVRRAMATLPEPEPDPQVHYQILRAAREAAAPQPAKAGFWGWFSSLSLNPAFAGLGLAVLAAGAWLALSKGYTDSEPPAPARTPMERLAEPPAVAQVSQPSLPEPPAQPTQPTKSPEVPPQGAADGVGLGGNAEPQAIEVFKTVVAGTQEKAKADAEGGLAAEIGALARKVGGKESERADPIAKKAELQALDGEGKAGGSGRPGSAVEGAEGRASEAPRSRRETKTAAAPRAVIVRDVADDGLVDGRTFAPPPPDADGQLGVEAKGRAGGDQGAPPARRAELDQATENKDKRANARPAPPAFPADETVVLGDEVRPSAEPVAPPVAAGRAPSGPAEVAGDDDLAKANEEEPAAAEAVEAPLQAAAAARPSGGAAAGPSVDFNRAFADTGADAPAAVKVPTEERQAPPSALVEARSARQRGDHSAAVEAYQRYFSSNRSDDQFAAAMLEAARSYEILGETGRALQLYRLAARSEDGRISGEARTRIAAIESVSRAKTAAPAPDFAEQDAPGEAAPAEPARADPAPPE